MRKPSTSERRAWETARGRCFNPTDKDFHLYGERGVTMCDRWESFEVFLVDMGLKPSPRHQLDRVRNEGNYEPGNCRWATPAQQAQNRRVTKLCALSAVLIRHFGCRGVTRTRLSRMFGVDETVIGKIQNRRIWKNAIDDLISPPLLSAPSLRRGVSGMGPNAN